MKKSISILFLFLCVSTLTAPAQIPNNGFESLNQDGSVSNWGNVYLFTLGDSIVIDSFLYAASNDAHAGSKAMELRNGYDFTTNIGIAGSVSSDEDSVFNAWGSFVQVPVQYTPVDFSFYYKYFPLNGDSAFARLDLFDSLGNHVGEALTILSGTTSSYTLASVPVVYSAPDPVAFYSLNFSTFYTDLPGYRQPSLGTRLLIDDVNLVPSTGISEREYKDTWIVYPNPATDLIRIVFNSKSYFIVEVTDMIGRILLKSENENRMDVSCLAKGVYTIRKYQDGEWLIKKFVKG